MVLPTLLINQISSQTPGFKLITRIYGGWSVHSIRTRKLIFSKFIGGLWKPFYQLAFLNKQHIINYLEKYPGSLMNVHIHFWLFFRITIESEWLNRSCQIVKFSINFWFIYIISIYFLDNLCNNNHIKIIQSINQFI